MAAQMDLDGVAGGSLNSVRIEANRIIKSYDGLLERGYEKLRQEYNWLNALPEALSASFAKPIELRDTGRGGAIELHLERVQKTAVTKAILSQALRPVDVAATVSYALSFLIDKLYPLRGDTWQANAVYERVHRSRITLAKKYLRRVPYLLPILECTSLRVNDVECPSVNKFLRWLDDNVPTCFVECKVVSFHGNFHLDNVLVTIPPLPTGSDAPVLIDPRGDLLGPAHADVSKLLITLEAYYDEIHYGEFRVDHRPSGREYIINLVVSEQYDEHYRAGLTVARDRLEAFADSEGVNREQFLRSTLVTECIHILSFCFYHAYRSDSNADALRAYIAVFGLLARRLMTHWTDPSAVSFGARLLQRGA